MNIELKIDVLDSDEYYDEESGKWVYDSNKVGQIQTLEEFFSEDLESGNGIKYGFLNSEGEAFGVRGVCHADMDRITDWAPGTLVRYYSMLRYSTDHDNYDDAKCWWDFIFGPDSPWRLVIKDLEFIKVGDRPVAFSVSIDDNTSNQVLTNLAIASRLPYEHPDVLGLYLRLISEGSKPVKAIYIASHFQSYSINSFTTAHYDRGHFPFNSHKDFSWIKFKDGLPAYDLGKRVRAGGAYTPCNSIWSGADGANFISLFKNACDPTFKDLSSESIFFLAHAAARAQDQAKGFGAKLYTTETICDAAKKILED